MSEAIATGKEALIDEIRAKIESIQARLRENQIIIDQNQLEVDRLQQKSVNISAQLKRVEDNFDTVPRQDIRVAYESAIDSRIRLVSMRSQLEKLQDAQNYLSEFKDTLTKVLNLLQQGGITIDGPVKGASNGGAVLSLAGEQIIRIVEAQESERKRLANALHDGPAQSLTNFILQAEICQRLFDRDPDSASVELNNLKSAASVSFQKIRDFIFELRPMMLDDLGLIATLRRHTENHNQKHENSKITFHVTGPADRRFPSHIEVMMFRGLQQLISNALDINNAKTVEVKLDVGDRVLKGVVEDDGRHFDPEVVLDREQGDHPLQNLLDLRERLQMVGGDIDIFSEEGKGSSIEIVLPYTQSM